MFARKTKYFYNMPFIRLHQRISCVKINTFENEIFKDLSFSQPFLLILIDPPETEKLTTL